MKLFYLWEYNRSHYYRSIHDFPFKLIFSQLSQNSCIILTLITLLLRLFLLNFFTFNNVLSWELFHHTLLNDLFLLFLLNSNDIFLIFHQLNLDFLTFFCLHLLIKLFHFLCIPIHILTAFFRDIWIFYQMKLYQKTISDSLTLLLVKSRKLFHFFHESTLPKSIPKSDIPVEFRGKISWITKTSNYGCKVFRSEILVVSDEYFLG